MKICERVSKGCLACPARSLGPHLCLWKLSCPALPGDPAAGPIWISYRGFLELCFTPGTASISFRIRHFLGAGVRPAFFGRAGCTELSCAELGAAAAVDAGAGEGMSALSLQRAGSGAGTGVVARGWWHGGHQKPPGKGGDPDRLGSIRALCQAPQHPPASAPLALPLPQFAGDDFCLEEGTGTRAGFGQGTGLGRGKGWEDWVFSALVSQQRAAADLGLWWHGERGVCVNPLQEEHALMHSAEPGV